MDNPVLKGPSGLRRGLLLLVPAVSYVVAAPVALLCGLGAIGITLNVVYHAQRGSQLLGSEPLCTALLLLCALLAGLVPGAVIGLLWPRRRLIAAPASAGLLVMWYGIAGGRTSSSWNGEVHNSYLGLVAPLFFASSLTLCLGGFLLAYRLVSRGRTAPRGLREARPGPASGTTPTAT